MPLAVSPAELHTLPPILGICAGVLALGVVWLLWWVTGHAITAAHAGGKVLVGRSFGFSVKTMKLNRNRSGVIEFTKSGGTGAIVVLLSGYLAPSLFGLGGAVLLSGGKAVAVLWISVAFLLVELLVVRNAFGYLSILVTGVLLFALLRFGPVWVQVFFGYVWVWFLLIGGVRQIGILHHVRKTTKPADRKTDADLLAKATRVPAPLWTGLFAVGTVLALLAGGAYLLKVLPWH